MRVPQVKETPTQALRAMFAGIGQMLHISDKLRGKSAASPNPETVVPATAAPQAAAPQTTAPEAVATETVPPATATFESGTPEAGGHVRLIQPDDTVDDLVPATALAADPAPAVTDDTVDDLVPAVPDEPAPVVADDTVDDLVPAVPDEPAPVVADTAPAPAADVVSSAELPLANYDDLTIASLRARLRNLSAEQLGQLIEYEKSHASRADVITMFERRIAKLAAG